MSLPTAPLGKNGPQVTRVGFGAMGLSAYYGDVKPDNERFAVLDKAYELGDLFWDTADAYNDNEELLGKWFKANPGKREKIFLATKFAVKTGANGEPEIDSSPEYAKEACAKSLQRLGVQNIDLYYAHRVDQKTPIEKTIQGLVELKNEGKIKYIGLSEVSSESLRRAHKVHPITAVQVEYSPYALEIESEQFQLLKTARELGVAIVAYSPLGRGMITGAIQSLDDLDESDFRRYAPRFSAENFPKNMELTKQLGGIAKKKGITPSQLVLAWLLAQGEDIFPIPGTTRVPRLEENLGSLHVELTEEENKAIRKYCENADVVGGRYPESFSSSLFADTPSL
ncbi:putative aldo-keto reductase [Lophiostoma macrostomum CBS 122681]|uniref:Putative aldo-keto reductase n=1 Tax=Lophiostoma macrostomum CBS 122681 TaxID=1314788 RepID=A0A6A6TTQ7_9PLEO|nr:putative aldo-keto reductase [Lophiostoma macrostomum CBS 122681]